jgi:hypothetical protein
MPSVFEGVRTFSHAETRDQLLACAAMTEEDAYSILAKCSGRTKLQEAAGRHLILLDQFIKSAIESAGSGATGYIGEPTNPKPIQPRHPQTGRFRSKQKRGGSPVLDTSNFRFFK